MEFDCYQHYFLDDFDTEEDFYKSTAPSEDIWKKFELLPTPPMSPTRTLPGSERLSPGDRLSWLTKLLGQDEECEVAAQFLPDHNLSSIIIQDCMWSSFSCSKQLEKVSGGRMAAAPAPLTQISVRPSKAHCAAPCGPVSTAGVAAAATDCVDPAAVLTFPPASSCRKPASSGSESRTDSSDDEEEIDVVTVESKQKRVRLVNVRKPVTITVRADPCPKRFHMSVHRQQHNYAAPSPDSEPEPENEEDEEEEEEEEEDEMEEEGDAEYEEEPRCKRVCTAPAQQPGSSPHGSQPSSPSETPQSSDGEDTDRRRNHNFLERKRRNDLRSRFLALRDQIPGLESAKTPKVVILTQATEYLAELHSGEKHQLQEKKRLRSRQQQLLRKLSELKRS